MSDVTYAANRAKADAVAIPLRDRPKKFIVADSVIGDGNGSLGTVSAQQLDDILTMESELGINTLGMVWMGTQTPNVKLQAALKGITRFRIATSAPYGPGPFSWQTQYFSQASVDFWADEWVLHTLANPSSGLSWQREYGYYPEDVYWFPMFDEPGWYYPAIVDLINADPGAPAIFRTWLQGRGFVPGDFGKSAWSEVVAIPSNQAVDLPSRKLFVQTVRFVNYGVSDGLAQLKTAFNLRFPNAITQSNYNNFPNRSYAPSNVGPGTANGGPDWGDFGRARSVGAQAAEDWFHDIAASYWAPRMDMLRSAGHEYGQLCGGYIVGRELGGAFPVGGTFRAFSMIGHGAKIIEWYTHGPEERFPANGYSNTPLAYGSIAAANQLIGRSEDLLYPAQVPKSKIAMLHGVSAGPWNVKHEGVPVVDQMLWESEMELISRALHHVGWSTDYLDEVDVETGKLDGYTVLCITSPNCTVAAQNKILAWINAGGVAVFSPGSIAADEYNTPTHILDAAMGITTTVIDRQALSENGNLARGISYLDIPIIPGIYLTTPNSTGDMRQQTINLSLTTATKIAQYTDDSSAAASFHAYGSGIAICLGYWNAVRYHTLAGATAFVNFPNNWNADMRLVSTVGPRLAGVVKPAVSSIPVIETARLDCDKGIAVVVSNWTDSTQANFTVTVNDIDPSRIGRVLLVGQTTEFALSRTINGTSITVTIASLATDVNVLKIYFKRPTPARKRRGVM